MNHRSGRTHCQHNHWATAAVWPIAGQPTRAEAAEAAATRSGSTDFAPAQPAGLQPVQYTASAAQVRAAAATRSGITHWRTATCWATAAAPASEKGAADPQPAELPLVDRLIAASAVGKPTAAGWPVVRQAESRAASRVTIATSQPKPDMA
jgi:hypothetical protein